jgi:hypothetical protein
MRLKIVRLPVRFRYVIKKLTTPPLGFLGQFRFGMMIDAFEGIEYLYATYQSL